MASSSQRGPSETLSGKPRYRAASATTAMIAGQRDSLVMEDFREMGGSPTRKVYVIQRELMCCDRATLSQSRDANYISGFVVSDSAAQCPNIGRVRARRNMSECSGTR